MYKYNHRYCVDLVEEPLKKKRKALQTSGEGRRDKGKIKKESSPALLNLFKDANGASTLYPPNLWITGGPPELSPTAPHIHAVWWCGDW
jgi:hypothetical protein